MGSEWSHYTTITLFSQFMAPTRDNALVFLIYWRIIKSIVCKVHCYKHLLADECKRHAQLTQENEIRCQADTGKDLHPLVFRSLLDLQAAVLRLNKVRSAPAPPRPHWQSGLSHAPGWPALGTAQQLRRGKTGRERLRSGLDWTSHIGITRQSRNTSCYDRYIISAGVPRLSILIYYCVLCTEIDVSFL